uniref:snRNA-activating protein complex subunit 4 n=6 Tax=Parascaris univalens TaxID=6257 RepID=A0A915CDI1_PARUN
MNENTTAAVVDTVVTEDKESSFIELPPLVEDNDGIGVFVDTGRIGGRSTADGNMQQISGIYVSRTDRVEDGDQSAILAKLFDAQNVYITILEQFILQIERAIKTNRQNQKAVTVELKRALEQDSFMDKKKVPLQLFLPPYFRDKYDMVPSLNAEAKRRIVDGVYDSLIKEEKKWSVMEINNLRSAVLKAVIEKRVESLFERRQYIVEKIRRSGREINDDQMNEWRAKIEEINRTIQYHLSLPGEELLASEDVNYNELDWLKISNVDFLGIRSAKQLRLKWMYEESPQWSRAPWTMNELRKLYSLSKQSCLDWNLVADNMNTQRTAYQCLQKYRTAIAPLLHPNCWTKEEDGRLVMLAKAFQTNAHVPWGVVSMLMDGRSQNECRARYEQFSLLDKNRGKWSVAEDVALLCAVARYGTSDWTKVASMLTSRSRAQCRERWVNIFNGRVTDRPWSIADDEKLLYGIKMFGKGKWSMISSLVPGRSANDCKTRFRCLVNRKMKIDTEGLSASSLRFDTVASRRKRRQKVSELFAKLVRAGDVDPADVERILRYLDVGVDRQKELLSRVDPERRAAIEQAVDEINQRATSTGTSNKSIRELLTRDLQITADMLDDTTFAIVQRHYGEGSFAALPERRMLLSSEERVRFNSHLDMLHRDEDKKRFVIESLCELVERADERRFDNKETVQRSDFGEKAYRYFNEVLIDILLDHLENGTKMPPLAPCIATIGLSSLIQSMLPSLRVQALLLFHPISMDNSVPDVELSKEVTYDPEYQLLAMKMRAMLYLPMLMDRAIEPETSWQTRETQREATKCEKKKEPRFSNLSKAAPQVQSTLVHLFDINSQPQLTVRDVLLKRKNLEVPMLMPQNGEVLSLKNIEKIGGYIKSTIEVTQMPTIRREDIAAPEQSVAMFLASTLAAKKKAVESQSHYQQNNTVMEAIESVCARVRNMPNEQFSNITKLSTDREEESLGCSRTMDETISMARDEPNLATSLYNSEQTTEEKQEGKKPRKRRVAQKDGSDVPKKSKLSKESTANTGDEKKESSSDRVKRSAVRAISGGGRTRKLPQRKVQLFEKEQEHSEMAGELEEELPSRRSKRIRAAREVRRAADVKAQEVPGDAETSGYELGGVSAANGTLEFSESIAVAQGSNNLCEEFRGSQPSKQSKRSRTVRKIQRVKGVRLQEVPDENGTSSRKVDEVSGANALSVLSKNDTESQGDMRCEESGGCTSSTQSKPAKVQRRSKVEVAKTGSASENDIAPRLSEGLMQVEGGSSSLREPRGSKATRRNKCVEADRSLRRKFNVKVPEDSEVTPVGAHALNDLVKDGTTSQLSKNRTGIQRNSKLCEVYEEATSSGRYGPVKPHRKARCKAEVKVQEVCEKTEAEVEEIDRTFAGKLSTDQTGPQEQNKLPETPESLTRRSKRVKAVHELQHACDAKVRKISEVAETVAQGCDDVSEVDVRSQLSGDLMEVNGEDTVEKQICTKDDSIGLNEASSADSDVPKNEIYESKPIKRTRYATKGI